MDEVKFKELAHSWQLDIEDDNWEEKVQKEYRSNKITRIFSYMLGIMILIPSVIAMITGLFFEGETIMGIEVTRSTFSAGLVITTTSSLFMKAGATKLREDRLKTYLFLKDIKRDI